MSFHTNIHFTIGQGPNLTAGTSNQEMKQEAKEGKTIRDHVMILLDADMDQI